MQRDLRFPHNLKSLPVMSPSAVEKEAHRKEKTSITLVFSGAKTIVNWEGN